MKGRIRGAVCFLLVVCLTAALAVPAQAATSLPDSIYLTQEGDSTCTLCAAAMMIRARMYLDGNSQWSSVTESGIRSAAWVNGMGLLWSFTYERNGGSVTVSHTPVSGMSIDGLKSVLDAHPEGIVLYCGGLPHAVFLTDYEGDTFYCAEPTSQYSGRRITLAESWLGRNYDSQAAILSNVTAYWFVSSHTSSGSGTPAPECGCSTDYAGEYFCTAGDSLNIRSGHGTGYSVIGSIPSGAAVTVTKASGTGSSDWAHVTYNGISGYVTMGFLSEEEVPKTKLEITGQPSDVTARVGETITLTVSAKGEGVSYQWQCRVAEYDPYGAVISESWKNVGTGGQSAALTLSGTVEKNGLRYRCVITDRYGNTAASDTATVYVKAAVQDCGCDTAYAGTYICTAGDSLNIRSGHGTGYSVIGSIPSGAAVTVTKASGTGSSDWAHVTYNGISGCVSMDYFSKKGDPQTALEITKQPKDASGALGDRLILSTEATGEGLSYQWQYSSTGNSHWKNSAENGNRTGNLSILAAEDCDGLWYRCVVTDAHETVRYTNAVLITVTSGSYTVSYNANGGTGSPGPQTKSRGATLKLSSAEPSREGYRFVGWSVNRDAPGADYQPGDSYTKDAEITLYAIWEKINRVLHGVWIDFRINEAEIRPGFCAFTGANTVYHTEGSCLLRGYAEKDKHRNRFCGFCEISLVGEILNRSVLSVQDQFPEYTQ